MEIIVIDDGINEKYAQVYNLKYNIEILDTLDIVERTNYDMSAPSHGSVCASIIKKYSLDCEIGSIKVLDSTKHTGSSEQLQMALTWCLNNNIKLINMSLGSVLYKDYEPIRLLIAKLLIKKCIIIAACHNRRAFSIPACLSGVIGVKSASFYSDSNYTYNKKYLDQAEIFASSQHLINVYNNEFLFTPITNSFAAPLITSIVYDMMQRKKGEKVCSIKSSLINLLDQKNNLNVCYSMRLDFIEKAIVYNYSNIKNSNNFFCEVNEWHDNPNLDKMIINDASVNLIILPPNHGSFDPPLEQVLTKFLSINRERINGILYGGTLSYEFMDFCNNEIHCLIWDVNAYYRLLDNITIPVGASGKPIICINGYNESLEMVLLLKKVFKDNGYEPLISSDIKYSYLYNFEYIPSPLVEDKIFYYLEENFDPDVFIFASNTFKKINADIEIKINHTTNIFLFNESTIEISEDLVPAKINIIYKYIVDFLNS